MIGTDGGGTFTNAISKYLVLTAPNGAYAGSPGSMLGKGGSTNITWQSGGLAGNVILELYQNGKKKGTIVTLDVNAGTYSWTVGKQRRTGTRGLGQPISD